MSSGFFLCTYRVESDKPFENRVVAESIWPSIGFGRQTIDCLVKLIEDQYQSAGFHILVSKGEFHPPLHLL
ncbi:hypothetical protein ASF33_14770 [Methylobacterium sp. Leaf92]|nr:hypothetical protein ASF33_14770 [Methylobacterium sp. Leaf92]